MKDRVFDIPYIKLHFYAEFTADTIMPETKVAAIRGGMGEMLIRQNCVTDQNCRECQFRKACIVWHTFYSSMQKKPGYVTGDESVGYLIECTDRRREFKRGSGFSFSLTLFGESIVFFNQYLQALYQLGMYGIGRYHSQFRILEVKNTQKQALVSGTNVDMRNYRISTIDDYVRKRNKELLRKEGKWTMTFLTPLNIKYQGERIQRFSPEALVLGTARRIEMLNYYIGEERGVPYFTEYPEIESQTVREERVRRYSGTQDSHMVLWGITGNIVFRTMPEECLDFLIAGELTHFGKNTSFGFGKYTLDKK